MARSLVQLNEQINNAVRRRRSELPSVQQVEAPEPTDELMAKVEATAGFTPDEQQFIGLFSESKQNVERRMQEDPGFEQVFMARIENLKGEELAQTVIDASDEVKIDFMKTNDPSFTDGAAATFAFLNSASFGQVSRLFGFVGETLQGRPAEEVTREISEKMRLLQKAFPKSDVFGQTLAFMVPGSPVKAVFSRVASIAGRGSAAILNKISKNPSLLSKVAQTATSLSAGAATVGGISGTLGRDLEEISLDRGIDEALEAGKNAATVALLPVAARGVSLGIKAAAPLVRGVARGTRKATAQVIEGLTGTKASALREFNKRSAELAKAAGSEAAVGDDLVDFLQSQRAKLPEVIQANKLLPEFDPVSGKRMIDFLKQVKSRLTPAEKSAAPKINEWISFIESKAPFKTVQTTFQGPTGELIRRDIVIRDVSKIKATTMRNIVDDLQRAAAEQFGQESNALVASLKIASRLGRIGIEEVAVKTGGASGQAYVGLMRKAAEKRSVLKFISKRLGRSEEVMQERSERFIRNVFGANKTLQQRRMQELDQIYGTNFFQRSQLARTARQLGPEGRPGVLPQQTTGKSILGVATGGLVGGRPGAAIGAVASSPRAGAMILGASDNITGFVRRIVANPEALRRVKVSGASPLEVRRLAAEIENAFVKDGPISAGGMVRIVADTPFFVGLVHAFELAERKTRQKAQGDALEKAGPSPTQTALEAENQ